MLLKFKVNLDLNHYFVIIKANQKKVYCVKQNVRFSNVLQTWQGFLRYSCTGDVFGLHNIKLHITLKTLVTDWSEKLDLIPSHRDGSFVPLA